MELAIRRIQSNDAGECGRICYEAFAAIAGAHNFPADFPNAEIASGVLSGMISHQGYFGLVAEQNGKIVGSNFLDERNPISGVGPITVDPAAQNKGVGVRLMREVMARSASKGFAGIRLVQSGYHCRSLSLYSKLGFEIREPLACMQGAAINETMPGYHVRNATGGDEETCNRLCLRVHGHHRGGELRDAVARGTAKVVERAGRITGYTTQIAFFGHAVAESTDDLKAMISASESFGGPGVLVPMRNGELMRWCLAKGLRVTQPLNLMTMGLYGEPAGAYLPSIIY